MCESGNALLAAWMMLEFFFYGRVLTPQVQATAPFRRATSALCPRRKELMSHPASRTRDCDAPSKRIRRRETDLPRRHQIVTTIRQPAPTGNHEAIGRALGN